MSTLNEYQKRRYLGTEAIAFGKRGVDKVSQYFGVSKNTVYSFIDEIESGYVPELGRIRRSGGGRKSELNRHSEWFDTLKLVIGPRTAGLPQDEGVIWVQMSEVKDRNAQFPNIAEIREKATEISLPIISIDTKKKELIGNLKREGKVMAAGQPKSLDHDFATFSDGQIVPHGIYDLTKNDGGGSKYNPIEHRLSSQITRSWSGAPLLTIEDAAERAADTTTKTGLTVYVDINTKTYEIQRPIDESYDRNIKHRVVFQESLPKWNYLVKPA